MTRETPVTEPSEFSKKSCDFFIPNWYEKQPEPASLRPLNHDHVLLINRQETNGRAMTGVESKVYVIRMSDCNLVKLSLAGVYINWNGRIVKKENENYFDVVYKRKKISELSNVDQQIYVSRVRYSLDGELIQNVTEYVQLQSENEHPLWPTVISNSTYWTFTSKGSSFNFLNQFRSGVKSEVVNFTTGLISPVSTSNSKVGFCIDYFNDTDICRQYDSDGKLLFSSNVNFFNNRPDLWTYNLRDNGLIVVVFEFQKINQNLKVFRVQNDGQYYLLREIPYQFSVGHFKFLEVDEELCLKFTTFSLSTYTIKCFSKN